MILGAARLPHINIVYPVCMSGRGMHRASLGKWYHPKDVVPEGSSLDAASGGMQTPMTWNAASGSYRLQLQVPTKLNPVNLSLLVYHPGAAEGESF